MESKYIRKILGESDFERFQSGDSKIFNYVYAYYYPIIIRYVFSHCGNMEDAEELSQEAFVLLFKYRHSIESAHKLYPFLFVIAKRLTISYFRKQLRRQTIWDEAQIDLTQDQATKSVEDYIDHKELEAIYLKIVESLPEQQRKAYSLFKIDQIPQETIASLMEVSPNTVRNHISIATKTIRLRIQQLYFIFILISIGISMSVMTFI